MFARAKQLKKTEKQTKTKKTKLNARKSAKAETSTKYGAGSVSHAIASRRAPKRLTVRVGAAARM